MPQEPSRISPILQEAFKLLKESKRELMTMIDEIIDKPEPTPETNPDLVSFPVIAVDEIVWQEDETRLEAAISRIVADVCDDDARLRQLYCALCNVIWINPKLELRTSVSWRTAGGIIADWRARGEDYMDYYCSGIGGQSLGCSEGGILPWVGDAFAKMGWEPRGYPEKASAADAISMNSYWPRHCVQEGGSFFMRTDRGEIIVVKLKESEKPVRFQIRRFIAEEQWRNEAREKTPEGFTVLTVKESRSCAVIETAKGSFLIRRDVYADGHNEVWGNFASLAQVIQALDKSKPEENECLEKIAKFRETMDLAEI